MSNNVKNRTSKLLIVFTFLFNLIALPTGDVVEAVSLDNAVTVSVTDGYGEEVVPMVAVEIEGGDTAYNVLETATDGDFVASESEYGRFIEEIAGAIPSTEEGEYWGFLTNGQAANVGADNYTVQNGENIRFSLMTYPPTSLTATVGAADEQGQTILPETAVEVVAGSNAFDALHQATTQAGVPLEVSVDDQWMTAVNNIGSEPLGETEFWQFNVNGQPAPVGVSSYTLAEGDTISFEVVDWAAPEDTPTEEEPTEDAAGEDTTSETPEDQEREGQENQPSDPVEPAEPIESIEPTEPTEPTEPENEQPAAVAPNTTDLSAQAAAALESVRNYFGPTEQMTYGDEWKVWALSHDSSNNFDSYITSVAQAIEENNGQLGGLELQKIVISLSLLNQDATNFNGYNLVENMQATVNSTINAQIYTLLALDSLPEGTVDAATRQSFVDNILAAEIDGGGWAFFGSTPSVDMTAMALAALAPHSGQPVVQATIDRGISTLSDIQGEDGRFYEAFSGGNSSEAISQVIVGLTAHNIDPLNPDFVAPGSDLINNLLAFQQADGGFTHLMSDSSSNAMSSEQALLALAAYDLYKNGLGSVYQPTRIAEEPTDGEQIVVVPADEDQTAANSEQTSEDQTADDSSTDETTGIGQSQQNDVQTEEKTDTSVIATERSEESSEERAEADDAEESEETVEGTLPQTGAADSLSLVALAMTGAGIALTFKNRKNK